MENDINNPLEREANKESNRDPKKLRTLALVSLFSVLTVAGYHECSWIQFLDDVPDGKVVEGKEGNNSVSFSYEFRFYRWGGADLGLYDFNVWIVKDNGIYKCTMKLKDENSFSYELLSSFEAKNEDEVEEMIIKKIHTALPQKASEEDSNKVKNLVEEAIGKLDKNP